MADWVQQDGEWQCLNCEELFFNGKPMGYDFDSGTVNAHPEGLSPVSGRSGSAASGAGGHGRRALKNAR